MAAAKLKSPLPVKITKRELAKRLEVVEAGFLTVTQQMQYLGETIRALQMAKEEKEKEGR
jgi:hypothetical protein